MVKLSLGIGKCQSQQSPQDDIGPQVFSKEYVFSGDWMKAEMIACGKTAWVDLTNLVKQVSVWMSRFVIAFGDLLQLVLSVWTTYGQSVNDLYPFKLEC